ncbi:MAG: hypothetical protein D6B25_09990 [Desulfobulbaceae bacterium]|nr:MAG: hypothetical protein D6B25_09990 [Desulfobulbaceae bacterium]
MKFVLKLSILSLLLVFTGLLFTGGLFATGKDPKGPEKSGAISKPGYCCIEGELTKGVSEKVCESKKGTFYQMSERLKAQKECQPEKGWCCDKGKLNKATEAECKKLRGKYYDLKQSAQAKKECQPEEGWCCAKGKLDKATEAECKKLRGKYYDLKQSAQAKKECQPEEGWCCAKGTLNKTTEAECKKLRGKYYNAKLSAQAKKECRPEEGWCCAKGKLTKATEAECKKNRGKYYNPRQSAQAKKECQPEEGWCCAKGKLTQETKEECKKLRGKYYDKRQSAQAKKECQPEEGLCCVEGKLDKADEAACRKLRGKYYQPGMDLKAKRDCAAISKGPAKLEVPGKDPKDALKPMATAQVTRPNIPQPDLEAVRIWSETSGPLNQIAVEYRNNSTVRLSNALLGRIKVSASITEHPEMVKDMPSALLAPGATAIVRFEPTRPLTVNNIMRGRIDPTRALTESNEDNNFISEHVGGETDQPDLTISGITWDRQADSMHTGTSDRHFHVNIRNHGSGVSNTQWNSLRVQVSVGDRSQTYLVRNIMTYGSLTQLNAGAYSNVVASVPASDFFLNGSMTVTGTIDSSGAVTESNESNNSSSRTLDFGAPTASDSIRGTVAGRAELPVDPPEDSSDLEPVPMAEAPAQFMGGANQAPAQGGVLKTLPSPTIRILTPNASTFFTAPDELYVVAEWMDPTMSGAPPIGTLRVFDDVRTIANRGDGALVVPASGTQTRVTIAIPAGTAPGEYQVEWVGMPHWGVSEPFFINELDSDHHGLTISTPHTGDNLVTSSVDVLWQGWGDACNPDEEYTIWLFKGSSSGPDHRHWVLSRGSSREEETVTLPSDAENGDDYFMRIDIGPTCDGTTGFFSINR